MTENVLWYRKNAMPVNVKLREAIINALPFDIDKRLANLIVRTIFETIVKGVVRDGFVTIEGLGRFYAIPHNGKFVCDPRTFGPEFKGKRRKMWLPPRKALGFYACKGLRYLHDYRKGRKNNGTSGTD